MGRFNQSWDLMRQSLAVLRTNPRLAVFPVISAIACLAISVSFCLPLWFAYQGKQYSRPEPMHYVIMFAYYFCLYFAVTFFNAALIYCARETMEGRPATVSDGLTAAGRRLGPILGWSLVSATVGTALRWIGEESGIIGKIVVSIVGGAWNVVTFFVTPMLVLEGVGPIQAIKGSFATLRRTWGESMIGGAGIGLSTAALALIPVPLIIAAAFSGLTVVIVSIIVASALYWVLLSVVSASMSTIYRTAVYVYAQTGTAPSGFSASYIESAFIPKPKGVIGKLRDKF